LPFGELACILNAQFGYQFTQCGVAGVAGYRIACALSSGQPIASNMNPVTIWASRLRQGMLERAGLFAGAAIQPVTPGTSRSRAARWPNGTPKFLEPTVNETI
jgi:hypothetical protein